jgi:Family of unknown function (DUF6256)
MSSSLIRQDVLPVGVGYLLVMGALGTGLWLIRRQHGDAATADSRPDREAGVASGTLGREPGSLGRESGSLDREPGALEREPGAPAGPGTADPRPHWLRLARHWAGTAIGGYLLLMAVVILYYYGVARVGGAFIVSAFTGCALLIALSTPVYAAASWLAERHRRPGGRPGRPGRPAVPPAPGGTP